MASLYRHQLPQLAADYPFITDGGMETDLIFNRGLELPLFAAFTAMESPEGLQTLEEYFADYIAIARERGAGMVLDTPTWRANRDWGERLGYDRERLADVNRRGVKLMTGIRDRAGLDRPIVVNGAIGPRGDGYVPGELMSADEAEEYHAPQIATFAATDADMVAGITMNYVEEAIGLARAAQTQGMPVAISFTVETDGRLVTGQDLRAAIEAVDDASAGAPAYYMINCAHPTHFKHVLDEQGRWLSRIAGIRANASTLSHAELDEAEQLDDGNPDELAAGYAELNRLLPNLHIVGGCCGTDHRHVAAISSAV